MTREQFFIETAAKYGTDKLTHGYMPAYAKHLPERCMMMLEIGIENGESALMWQEIYGKDNLSLHYIDLFMNPDFVSPAWARNRGFIPYRGDQSDIHLLASIKDQFEVIADDGSHRADHQLISFKHLFVNNLQFGGIYVIEDLHCNEEEFYYGDFVTDRSHTPKAMFEQYLVDKKIHNIYFNDGESEMFENLIDRVEFAADNKMVFIWKK